MPRIMQMFRFLDDVLACGCWCFPFLSFLKSSLEQGLELDGWPAGFALCIIIIKKLFRFFLVSSLYLMRGPYTASKDVGKRGCCIQIKIGSFTHNLCGFYFAEEGSRILKGVPFQQLKHPSFKRNVCRIINNNYYCVRKWTFNFCQLEEQED